MHVDTRIEMFETGEISGIYRKKDKLVTVSNAKPTIEYSKKYYEHVIITVGAESIVVRADQLKKAVDNAVNVG